MCIYFWVGACTFLFLNVPPVGPLYRKLLCQSLSRKLMRFDKNTDAKHGRGLRAGGNGFFGIEIRT